MLWSLAHVHFQSKVAADRLQVYVSSTANALSALDGIIKRFQLTYLERLLSFDTQQRQGEGRAAAASRTLLLGETLPPLRLAFFDSLGNAVPAGGPDAPPALQPAAVRLEALLAPPATGGAPIPDLIVSADVAPGADGCLLVSALRVSGPPLAAPLPGGLRFFSADSAGCSAGGGANNGGGAGSSSAGSMQLAQRAPDSQAREVPVGDAYVAVHVEGFAAAGFAVKLRPGAPAALRLLPGAPPATAGLLM